MRKDALLYPLFESLSVMNVSIREFTQKRVKIHISWREATIANVAWDDGENWEPDAWRAEDAALVGAERG